MEGNKLSIPRMQRQSTNEIGGLKTSSACFILLKKGFHAAMNNRKWSESAVAQKEQKLNRMSYVGVKNC